MVWYGMMVHMVWLGMVWYGLVWYSMAWYDVRGVVRGVWA